MPCTATEQLQNDYTFYARASRGVNREGCGPKLRKILQIILEEKRLVNFGSSQAGKMTPEAGAHLLVQPCPCGIFNMDRCSAILKELKENVFGSV